MNNEEKGYCAKTTISSYPGHMAKTRREIATKLNLIDIVYEVIDARMPISSKIVDIDDLIKNKPKILIMTKYDLCDQVETNKFIKYYESLNYHVLPFNLLQDNVTKLISLSQSLVKTNTSRTTIRALIVGIPNVGKSTLINRLVGKKATSVGNRAGVTKQLNWIRINKDLELLDTPGILWPKMANQKQAHILASLSSIDADKLSKEDLAIFIFNILKELYPTKLQERYGLENLDLDIVELLDNIGKSRGALLKGGFTDYDKVYNIIIKDLQNGYFKNITLDR
jgi:ribosome biogenesis GTPase A